MTSSLSGELRRLGVEGAGTVNAIFRIGNQLAARFPLQGEDPDAVLRQLQAEAGAAAKLAGLKRFPTPEPVAIGAPGPCYGLPWSVQTWLPGVVATDRDPGDRDCVRSGHKCVNCRAGLMPM